MVALHRLLSADGLRTYKKVGSTVHEYEYSGDKLIYEKRGDTRFYYRYDSYGNIASIRRLMADGSDFTLFPITNARGDVVEVRLSNGNLYARYIYDSWGNIVSVRNPNGYEITDPNHYANQNPFRYRGYYYDAESGLYYLQSRYYDPVTGRFVNGDSQLNTESVLGFNMYAYCYNNPVTYVDSEGNRPIVGAGPISKETADERRQSAATMNPKIAKQKKGNSKGFIKTIFDAFSIKVGGGFGFGFSAEVGALGLEASIKGNPLHLVLTTKDEDRGLFYSVNSNVSMEFFAFEAFVRDNVQYEFWSQKDVSTGYEKDFRIKDSVSFGASVYLFFGCEFEVSFRYKDLSDYLENKRKRRF